MPNLIMISKPLRVVNHFGGLDWVIALLQAICYERTASLRRVARDRHLQRVPDLAKKATRG